LWWVIVKLFPYLRVLITDQSMLYESDLKSETNLLTYLLILMLSYHSNLEYHARLRGFSWIDLEINGVVKQMKVWKSTVYHIQYYCERVVVQELSIGIENDRFYLAWTKLKHTSNLWFMIKYEWVSIAVKNNTLCLRIQYS